MAQYDGPALPLSLQSLLADADWQSVTIGMSGANVYRIVAPAQPLRYLKVASGPRVTELRAERDRLTWLRLRLPVPTVLAWVDDPQRQCGWLLLTEAAGVMACDPAVSGDPWHIVRLLADGLRQIHGLPIADCPFDMRLAQRLTQAEWGIHQGLVDDHSVHVSLGVSAWQLLERLVATRPVEPADDLVFTHGDYCLPNVLLDQTGASVSAFLDWGRAGVADRYQDLAIGARSVRHNLGTEWGPRFLAAYTAGPLDQRRLDWYEALDELF